MIKSEERPKGMSQVDWLWFNYKYFNVQNEASEIPSERILLTEKAVSSMIQKASGGSITDLRFEEDPDNPELMRLMGTAINGEVLTVVSVPKEEHIVSFTSRKVTQTDIDNGSELKAGTDVLAITTNLNKVYLVSLESISSQISGGETNTVYSEVLNGVIYANIKIDEGNNTNSPINIKSTNQGIYAGLKLSDESTGVRLEITENGLKAYLPFEGGTAVKFRQLSLDEYLIISPEQDTVYFITDKPFIYLNGIKYGIDILPGDNPIVSLVYDADSMRLYYKKSDGTDIQSIDLGPVTAERSGMMTKEQYTDFQRLLRSIGDIVDIKEHVQYIVKSAAFSLEKGEISNKRMPLLLKDGFGNTLSTVDMDVEDYLAFAEQRAATSEDCIEAAKKGVLIEEGDALLILTLTSGDTVYVSLAQLMDIYTGEDTNTIHTSVNNYKISSDIIIPANEKILYESVNGLSARLSVKQKKNIVALYGKTDTADDKLGEFILSDQLLSYRVLRKFNEQMLSDFPPAQIDGADYDLVTNPIHFGHTYLVLTMGIDTNDSSTSYRYHYYLDITTFLDEIAVSSDEDNIITKGSDGHLYATISWIDVN